ncbi:MAG: response regulator transcription factor [Candidatus Omnitrophica bacterium]|nr:response regulator transcription factor [Candidatus Omnitrophota bacterium]
MEPRDNPETLPEETQDIKDETQKPMPKKILVVDDNTDALRTAEAILKKARYEVITLNNPKFIFKLIKHERPDVVVLDIIMPPLDGYTVCQEIRKLYGDKIPVLLCTAQSYEQDLIQKAYKEFGANDYILKPVKSEEFLPKIKTLVKISKQIKKKTQLTEQRNKDEDRGQAGQNIQNQKP